LLLADGDCDLAVCVASCIRKLSWTNAAGVDCVDHLDRIGGRKLLVAAYIDFRLRWVAHIRQRTAAAGINLVDDEQGVDRRDRSIAVDIERIDRVPPINIQELPRFQLFEVQRPTAARSASTD